MDSKCKNCKHSAWCLVETWPPAPVTYAQGEIELVTQVVRCRKCNRFWVVGLSEMVGSTVTSDLRQWKVRPCEQEEEEFGHVDVCPECEGAYPTKAELPMRNGGVCIVHFRDGPT